jgi:hypothetical protein
MIFKRLYKLNQTLTPTQSIISGGREKRTLAIALHMSAYDPKRTSADATLRPSGVVV